MVSEVFYGVGFTVSKGNGEMSVSVTAEKHYSAAMRSRAGARGRVTLLARASTGCFVTDT
ncbi:hypothetical protein [Nocardia sp. NPDC004260]